MFWRDATILECARQPSNRESTRHSIETIAKRDQALAAALTADWNTGRPPDSRAKSEPLFGLQPKDQLLFQWTRAAEYSASLAADPDRFDRMIESRS